MGRIYLDYNATAPLHPAAREAMIAALDDGGNPSSIHEEGRRAREFVEAARDEVAALLRADRTEIVFTSGGTEADCLGIVGLARLARAAGRPPRAIAAPVEHPAVLGAVRALENEGFETALAPVDRDGRVDPDGLTRELASGAAIVAIGLANHELGTLQDVAGLAALAREAGALVHCDAVQAAGRLPVEVGALGADAVAISAHKFGGPVGTGALWIAPAHDPAPLAPAGHQERERRPGTENVVGIAGMGAAARAARTGGPAARARVATLARRLEDGVCAAVDGARVHGSGAPRVGNTVNVGFDGALGEVVVEALDLAGVAASTGAACTSGSVAPSPVLRAIGLGAERAAEAVRLSLGPGTREEDIDEVLALLPAIVHRARAFR